jgi:hypothetical protein
MEKLNFALILFALGIGASRALQEGLNFINPLLCRLIPNRAPEVYEKIGVTYESVIIDPAAQEVLKATTTLHNAAEILQRRPFMKAEVQKEITAWLVKYGVEMKEAALANIRFDPAYEKAIESKQIEEQKAEQKRYELIQAQRQAEIVAASSLTARGQTSARGPASRHPARSRRHAACAPPRHTRDTAA